MRAFYPWSPDDRHDYPGAMRLAPLRLCSSGSEIVPHRLGHFWLRVAPCAVAEGSNRASLIKHRTTVGSLVQVEAIRLGNESYRVL